MNNQLATTQNTDPLMVSLKNSLYPGAKDESLQLVISYCKAAGLDPMQKPVHIVPMSVKEGDRYVYRDVIMPGIGLYRIQAARTGEYAGITEPEFGPSITRKLGGVEVTYPEWCRVSVKRIVKEKTCEFTAQEFWLENYATSGKNSEVPNVMWKKRPYGQLAKCAEAQALRKAYPEIGSQPTSDEMEGKSLEIYSDPNAPKEKNGPVTIDVEDVSIVEEITVEKITIARDLINRFKIKEDMISKWCEKANVPSLEEASEELLEKFINSISSKYE